MLSPYVEPPPISSTSADVSSCTAAAFAPVSITLALIDQSSLACVDHRRAELLTGSAGSGKASPAPGVVARRALDDDSEAQNSASAGMSPEERAAASAEQNASAVEEADSQLRQSELRRAELERTLEECQQQCARLEAQCNQQQALAGAQSTA